MSDFTGILQFLYAVVFGRCLNGGFINICYLNIVFLYLRCNFIVEHCASIPWNNFLYDFFLFLKSLIEGSDRLNLKNAYHSFIATHIAIYQSFCVLLITE